MLQYWAYGLLVESEIEFPELLPYQFETPDVTVRLGKTPETVVGDDVVHRVRVSISQKEYLLKCLNIANYYAANGNEIIIEPLPDGDEKTVRLFALSNAFAAVLYQRNSIPLHASGIIYKDGVVLFCGASGAGKSTTVTALKQKGYKVFTDDVCVLQQQPDGSIIAVPSYPMIKLWQDSFEKAGLEMADEENRIRQQLPKYANFFHDDFFIRPQHIRQIFVLEQNNLSTAVQINSLTALQAFTEIQKNVYRPLQMNAMEKRDTLFSFVSSLSKNTTIYKTKRLADENTLPELLSLIEAKLF